MRSVFSTIAWGVFCACSWTWCIGMYLPVIMVDRFGIPGFLVFAVPNVIGCAGFGYVLARRARSGAMVQRHGAAMLAFSLVAVAYHMFFITFLLGELFVELTPRQEAFVPIAGAIVVLTAGMLLSLAGDRQWLVIAAAVYVFSLIAFGIIGFGGWERIGMSGRLEPGRLVWLAPVVSIGFLLCPYLDLTFHRALRRSPSRHAFAVFGVTFAVMIVFTCFLWFSPRPALPWVGLAHIAAQTIFTVGAHLREVRVSAALGRPAVKVLLMFLPLIAVAAYPAARAAADAMAGEELYLRFLVCYGLVFPAYVLLFMGPWRPWRFSPRTLLAFAAVIVLLAPLYELGFIGGTTWLLAVPVGGLVLWAVVRQLVPRRAAPSEEHG